MAFIDGSLIKGTESDFELTKGLFNLSIIIDEGISKLVAAKVKLPDGNIVSLSGAMVDDHSEASIRLHKWTDERLRVRERELYVPADPKVLSQLQFSFSASIPLSRSQE